MKARATATTMMSININGVDLGNFTKEGADWNGLRCLCNAEGEKIIVQVSSTFADLISFITKDGVGAELDIVSLSPSLLAKVASSNA